MPSTLIASKAPNSSLPLLICASLFLHLCVWTWWPGGGFGVKGLQWSWECGKPPLVWSNHSSLSIILPPSLPPSDLSQPITPQSCLSPPFHYSHLTGQKIRVTLGGLLSSPTSLSLHRPSFYFSPITPSSLVGIWRVTLGQFNLSSLSADQSSKSVTASLLWAYPFQQDVSLFSTLHTSPALLCYTELSISSSVTPVFHSLVFFFFFTSDFLCPPCLWEDVSGWPCCAAVVMVFVVQLYRLRNVRKLKKCCRKSVMRGLHFVI